MVNFTRIISLIVILALWGCSKEEIPFVYRIDIQQGNVVTQEMLAKLKPGQDKRLVTHIMGTPLLVDVFHQDQWIYLYSFQKGHNQRVQRRISLYFENDLLTRISGDVRPAEPAQVAQTAPKSRSVDVPPGSGDEDGGFLQSVIDTFSFERDRDVVDPAMEELKREAENQAAGEVASQTSEPEAGEGGILDRLRQQLSGDEAESKAGGETPAASGETNPADSAELRRKYSFDGSEIQPAPKAETTAEPEPEPAPEAEEEDGESFFDSLKKKLGLGEDKAEQ